MRRERNLLRGVRPAAFAEEQQADAAAAWPVCIENLIRFECRGRVLCHSNTWRLA